MFAFVSSPLLRHFFVEAFLRRHRTCPSLFLEVKDRRDSKDQPVPKRQHQRRPPTTFDFFPHSSFLYVCRVIRQAAGVVADDVTLGHAATACARGGDLDDALIILRAMAAKGMGVARAYNLALVAIAHGKTGPSRSTRCPCKTRWFCITTFSFVLSYCYNIYCCTLLSYFYLYYNTRTESPPRLVICVRWVSVSFTVLCLDVLVSTPPLPASKRHRSTL